MDEQLVFVYGTLRGDGDGAMPKRFPAARFVAAASVRGKLYDLGAYPGLIADESDSKVIGEVYEIDEATLVRLDAFEASSNYLRREVELTIGGRRTSVWTYQPSPEYYSLCTVIASGDWSEHVKTRTVQE